MKMKTWMQSKDACGESLSWIGNRTPEQAWAECDRSDWMFWALGRTNVDKKLVVRISCDIALSVLPLSDDPRVDKAIQTALAWCDGLATEEQCSAARSAARSAAYSAASSAAYSAADAARSAADAAYSAARSAAYSAASSAAYSAAWQITFVEARREIADLIRTHLTPAEFAKLVQS